MTAFEDTVDRSNSAPARRAKVVSPHDTNELVNMSRGLYVGTGGDVDLITAEGDAVLFKNVPSGSILPVVVKQVKATLTTASNIVALFSGKDPS